MSRDIIENYQILKPEIKESEESLQEIKYDNPSREVLLELYWEDYTSSVLTVLFGRGVCATHDVKMAPHNSFIGMLWNVGAIGAILFLSVVLYIILKLKAKYSIILLLIPFLIMCLVETLFFTMWFWLLFVVLINGENCLNVG